jgi:hypothetical protein
MVINLAHPSKYADGEEPPVDSTAAESESEPREEQADVSRCESSRSAESGVESRDEDVSDSTRADLLGRREFRALFYSQGLSPSEVMGLLNLSPEHVGTLMRYHGVGAFGHSEVPDERIGSLLRELSDEEWRTVVEGLN